MKKQKEITAYVGPVAITLDGKAVRLEWFFAAIGIYCGHLSGDMPEKITDAELAAFREWLSKCPFDPDIYNRD